MFLRTLALRNVGLYDDQEIEFPHPGLILLEGENGVGKSIILEAISVGGWNTPIREAKDGWTLWNGKSGSIRQVWQMDDGSPLEIIRRFRSGKTTLDATHKGTPIGGATPTEVQQNLCRLIGERWEFRQSAVYSKEMVDKLAAGTDSARGELIDQMRGLEGWEELRQDAANAYREAVRFQEGIQQAWETQKERVDDLKARAAELADRIRGLKRDPSVTSRAEELRCQIDVLRRRVAKFRMVEDEDTSTLDKQYQSVWEEYNRLTVECDHLQTFVRDEESSTKHALQCLSKTCPTCLRPISKKEVKTVEVSRIQALEPRKRRIDELGKLVAERTKLVEEVGKRVAVRDKKKTEARDSRLRLEEEMEGLEEELRDLKPALEEQERIEGARAEAERQRKETLEEATRQALVLQRLTKEGEDAEFAVARCRLVGECYGAKGVRTQLREEALITLQEEVDRTMSILGASWRLRFSATKTTKAGKEVNGVSIKPEGAGGGYLSGLSAGQHRRGDVATVLAFPRLRPTSRNYQTLGFDEVLDVLDPPGLERMAELLTEKAESSTVICVTHSTALRELFPNARQVMRVMGDGLTWARLEVV